MTKQTLKELLKGKLTEKEIALMPRSFDTVGDIIIFSDFPSELKKKEKLIGKVILEKYPHIKVIAKKTKKYSGKFRTPTLRIIVGERRKETIYKENNVRLKLNVEKVYFSSRLATERQRIIAQIKRDESVLVMFSGCGPYVVEIAKNTPAKEVYGVEINPIAHKYALENLILNKIKNVKLFLGDVRNVLPKIKKKFDRILMPLPKDASDYLDVALKKIKKNGVINFYEFANDDEQEALKEKITKICADNKKKIEIISLNKCGDFGPGIFRYCVDFRVL